MYNCWVIYTSKVDLVKKSVPVHLRFNSKQSYQTGEEQEAFHKQYNGCIFNKITWSLNIFDCHSHHQKCNNDYIQILNQREKRYPNLQ